MWHVPPSACMVCISLFQHNLFGASRMMLKHEYWCIVNIHCLPVDELPLKSAAAYNIKAAALHLWQGESLQQGFVLTPSSRDERSVRVLSVQSIACIPPLKSSVLRPGSICDDDCSKTPSQRSLYTLIPTYLYNALKSWIKQDCRPSPAFPTKSAIL